MNSNLPLMKATPSAMKRDLIKGVASLEIGNLVDTISVNLKSGLIRGVAFGESGFISVIGNWRKL